MRTIFISAGHSNTKGKDMGAVGNGYIEGELAVELRDLIVKELVPFGIEVIIDNNSNILAETLSYFKKIIRKDAIFCDIHWNASSNPQANGTEVLIPGEYNSFEYNLACSISGVITNILNTKPRGTNGVKTELESHHGRLGWMRLNGNNILIEVCFISNASDMEKYQKNKLSLAKQLAATLKRYSEK